MPPRGVLDIAARPAIVFHHDQEGRFIAWSGHSPLRGKSKFLYIPGEVGARQLDELGLSIK